MPVSLSSCPSYRQPKLSSIAKRKRFEDSCRADLVAQHLHCRCAHVATVSVHDLQAAAVVSGRFDHDKLVLHACIRVATCFCRRPHAYVRTASMRSSCTLNDANDMAMAHTQAAHRVTNGACAVCLRRRLLHCHCCPVRAVCRRLLSVRNQVVTCSALNHTARSTASSLAAHSMRTCI